MDVVRGLEDFGCAVDILDPWADPAEVMKYYGLESMRTLPDGAGGRYDAIVLAVAHREFGRIAVSELRKRPASVVFDIKGMLPREEVDGRL